MDEARDVMLAIPNSRRFLHIAFAFDNSWSLLHIGQSLCVLANQIPLVLSALCIVAQEITMDMII